MNKIVDIIGGIVGKHNFLDSIKELQDKEKI